MLNIHLLPNLGIVHQMKHFISLIIVFIISAALTDDKPAYRIFNREGKSVDYDKMLKEIRKADIVFFGELHNNSICHWLELQVTKDLYSKQQNLALAMEMFEADNQIVLDEYLNGTIEEKHLLKEAKMWENYKTDYKPLVDFAKKNKLKVIASNMPRRYANLVYRKGINALDSLPEEAKKWIAPLPIEVDLELPGYKSLMASDNNHAGSGNPENMAKSQAVKDATMAHFILKNKKGTILHFNGAYHSKNDEGIIWYLKKANSSLKTVTIHTVEQDTIDKLEESNKNAADFIICVPNDMTKTY